MRRSLLYYLFFIYCFLPVIVDAQTKQLVRNIKIDGAQKFQVINGIGVNANTRSWNGKELEPALDLLLDSMHATIWRVCPSHATKQMRSLHSRAHRPR